MKNLVSAACGLVVLFFGTGCVGIAQEQADPNLTRLQVSPSGRWLQYSDGRPFFYLGDTAWELFHRLDRQEADRYLDDRAAKGFTVIQAVVLAERDGLGTANAYGHTPLVDKDPARPDVRPGNNDDYWDHVDYVVGAAAKRGLVIGMLPTWGSHWSSLGGGKSRVFDVDNAREYGRWIAARYSTDPIIWILGGDRNIYNDQDRQIVESMAQGLREGDQGHHLITFHPRGPGRSSDYFHNASWLDFNMVQSSHAARDHDNGRFIRHDYELRPVKPTLDGEPRYERIPVGFYLKGMNPDDRFDDNDVRQAAWWAMMSGACGHTYGNNSVWQMWSTDVSPAIHADVPWHQALDDPGAAQMGWVRKLFEQYDYQTLRPDREFIVDAPKHGGAHVRGMRSDDGALAMVYSPQGEPFMIDVSLMRQPRTRASWYDPRTGQSQALHTMDSVAFQTFTPPSRGRGNDWVLVLESVK
ncbi:glycoside hydrolase family 140 protein [Crateriforma conspicua]|uniref:glycoside hydrolase family 140 protein n=1 Tax=Crateriforma conspicua TaxID=2527996 RepID=UPI00118B8F15|nr:glycoside hydrolase family 140 protein [Crateriforma conspicua]QDV61030.1 Putative endoglucanase [Crateriforma conspicua]